MAPMMTARLTDRVVLLVSGEDRIRFLQDLLTADLTKVARERVVFGGLLSPQGKLLFDMFIVATREGYLIDTARSRGTELVNRLNMYKLHAKVDIKSAENDFDVLACWGDDTIPVGEGPPGRYTYRDPRHEQMGWRVIVRRKPGVAAAPETDAERSMVRDYHAHRIALGVPEGGKDYAFGDVYPHEANFDQLGGLSPKGCYVGQEVVSRMQHKAIIKRRVVRLIAAKRVKPGLVLSAQDVELGVIGSTHNFEALALIRLDRALEFVENNIPIMAGDIEVKVTDLSLRAYKAALLERSGAAE